MKAKITACALAAILVLSLTACSGGAQSSAPTASAAAAQTAQPTQAAATQSTQSTQAAAPDDAPANFNKEGFPIVNDKITLSATQRIRDIDDYDFTTMPFYTRLEETTNIHIEWDVIKESDYNQKLNLMIASGELTDLILKSSIDYDEYGANQGLLIPLDDLIAQYMPNYSERLLMDNVNDSIPSPDGKSYFIGYFRAEGINSSGHWFINKTWMDRLSLEVPETVDQLTDVLRAFKTQDPNQNGEADEVPYQSMFKGNMAGLTLAFPFWGVPEPDSDGHILITDDGVVKFTALEPGYRQAVEWFHTLYTEGLIDPECITQDQSVFAAKLNTGTVGFFPYWRLAGVGIADEIVADFQVMLPVNAEGYQTKMSRRIELPGFGAAITSTCATPEAAARWIDAQLETETMLGSIGGNENLFINDDGKYQMYAEGVNPEWVETTGQYPGVNGQYFAPKTWYFENWTFGTNIIEKAGHSELYENAGVMEKISSQYATQIGPMNSEDKAEVTRLKTEIVKFMDESVTSFMVSGVTDAGWENFLNTLNGLNIARYCELYQQSYDAFTAMN